MKIIARGGLVAALFLSSLLYAQEEMPLGDVARKIRAEKADSQASGSISKSPEQVHGQNADSSQSGAIGNFAFSPDGQFILLSRSRATSSFLYKVALDTGRADRLTSASSGYEGSPSFSPDGKYIAFSYSQGNSHSRIFIVDADGNNAHPLFPSVSEADDFSPVFTTTGKTIYFARSAFFGNYSPIARPSQHEWDIFSVDIDGRNLKQITNERFYDISAPSLSMDGKKMLFSTSTQEGSRFGVYLLDRPSKPKSVFQPHVPNEPRSPIFGGAVFAPDGKSILFMAASEGSRGAAFDYDVYQMELRSGSVTKLTSANGYATNLCVSPDGKKAIFMRWTSDEHRTPVASQLYLLDLETRQVTPLPISGSR